MRILLVEDHEDTLRVMAKLLRAWGYDVRTATTARAALAAASAEPFDVLISDLRLPDASGLELMRTLGALRPIRGIAITGAASEHDVERSREAGFALHFAKPVDFEELRKALEAP